MTPGPPGPRFKVGQRVICVKAPGTGQLVEGQGYQVKEVFEPALLVGLNVWPGMWWGSFRFKAAPALTVSIEEA